MNYRLPWIVFDCGSLAHKKLKRSTELLSFLNQNQIKSNPCNEKLPWRQHKYRIVFVHSCHVQCSKICHVWPGNISLAAAYRCIGNGSRHTRISWSVERQLTKWLPFVDDVDDNSVHFLCRLNTKEHTGRWLSSLDICWLFICIHRQHAVVRIPSDAWVPENGLTPANVSPGTA